MTGESAVREPVLAVGEIQGNVLPGFNTRYQCLLGVTFARSQTGAARSWLRTLVPSVSTLQQVNDSRMARRAARQAGATEPLNTVLANVAFDVKGLALLASAIDDIKDEPFRQGMGEQSNLGDPGEGLRDHEGHPSRWKVGGTPQNTPEVLVILGSDDPGALSREAGRVRDSAVSAGLEVPYRQEAHVLDGEVEHFGFRDGISQVGPRGRLSEKDDDYLTRRAIDPSDERWARFGRPGQPLVWPGQFVFGYERQLDDDPLHPAERSDGGYPWMDNGSYLVFRRLRQDVPAFRRFVAEEAGRLAGAGVARMTPERLAALLVGRWPKGTALVHNPSGDDPDPMADRYRVNHFNFEREARPVDVWDDTANEPEILDSPWGLRRTIPGSAMDRFGQICPRFAHIRKVNPRDRSTDQGGPARTLGLAVLRRGITWGEPFPSEPAAQEEDDGQRGLLFLCYQTSIERQFRTLNTVWMNHPMNPEGDSGHDLLTGQGSDRGRERAATLGSTGQVVKTLAEWVVPTGGGYFFSPSISTLKQFAGAG